MDDLLGMNEVSRVCKYIPPYVLKTFRMLKKLLNDPASASTDSEANSNEGGVSSYRKQLVALDMYS